MIVSNQPRSGGTHLPNITAMMPVFSGDGKQGYAFKSFFLIERGRFNEQGIAKLLSEAGTRNLSQRSLGADRR